MEKNELFRLILSIIICQMAGIMGSITRYRSGEAIFSSTGILYRINLDRSLHPNGHFTLPYLKGDSQ